MGVIKKLASALFGVSLKTKNSKYKLNVLNLRSAESNAIFAEYADYLENPYIGQANILTYTDRNIVSIPFSAGRNDATQDNTDVDSFSVLEPKADGFRNYMKPNQDRHAEELLLDKAHLLTLSAPEMTVLLAGMRVLDTNYNLSLIHI